MNAANKEQRPINHHPEKYEDGEAPWSEDEQFDEQQKACDARCKKYGRGRCEEKDDGCSECEYDAQVALRAKHPVAQ